MRNPPYHRITEWLMLEGTLRLILSHCCHGQGHFPLDEIAQSPSSLALLPPFIMERRCQVRIPKGAVKDRKEDLFPHSESLEAAHLHGTYCKCLQHHFPGALQPGFILDTRM